MKPLSSQKEAESKELSSFPNSFLAALTQGSAPNKTNPLPSGKKLTLSDGPSGVRPLDEKGDSLSGIADTLPSTAFPALGTLACSFNPENFEKMGQAIGEECAYYGVDVLLGPAINIQRNPLCGRNFEYCSEDPLLSGAFGSAFVKGVQSEGVGATPKHFACNGNEDHRFAGDSIVSERALQEIYLKAFRETVEESHPWALMTAYNKINHVFCSENPHLLQDILRKEWGFDGVVMTDWGGTHDKIASLSSGCNLEMPGQVEHNVALVVEGLEKGTLGKEEVISSLNPLLDLEKRTAEKAKKEKEIFSSHADLALSLALDSIVLLKNEDTVLPLSPTSSFACVGEFFSSLRYQGSGSSMLNPFFLSSFPEAFQKRKVSYCFAKGFLNEEEKGNEKLEKEALEGIKGKDVVLFFAGMDDFQESEGYDKTSLCLKKNQDSLLKKILETGKKVVLILFSGTPLELTSYAGVSAILWAGLGGENSAEAVTRILFGEENPSGKLAQTWPFSQKDIPGIESFGKSNEEYYKEDIFVGYRYYSTFHKEVAYPFGFGLSYTDFRLLSFRAEKEEHGVSFLAEVKNVGGRQGKEVLQVYVKKPRRNGPVKELVAFAKFSLEKGEAKQIRLACPDSELCAYSSSSQRLELQTGKYVFYAGFSSADTPLEEKLEIQGSASTGFDVPLSFSLTDEEFCSKIGVSYSPGKPGKRPYTMETPLREMNTLFGKIFTKAVAGVGKSQYNKGKRLEDPKKREAEMKAGNFVYRMMPANSLRSMCFSSSGAFSYKMALLMLGLVNNHPIQGLKQMIQEEKNHGKNKK